MLLLALLLQAAPPIPPPPALQLAAALDLWRVRPLQLAARRDAVRFALLGLAGQALTEAKVKPARYYEYLFPMVDRLEAGLPADPTPIDTAAELCLVDAMARTLSVEDLAAAKAFVATPAGGRFWDVAVLYREPLRECYRAAVQWPAMRLIDGELARVGLKRPPAKPRDPFVVD